MKNILRDQCKEDPLYQIEEVRVEEEIKALRSFCRMCHGDCGTLVHLLKGKVIEVEGDPEHPMNSGSLCVKGLSSIQQLYSPYRLNYPLMRIGKRDEGRWKRTSWDETNLSKRAGEALKKDKREETFLLLNKQKEFLQKHLSPWVPFFCKDIKEVARSEFYKSLTDLLIQWILSDSEELEQMVFELNLGKM